MAAPSISSSAGIVDLLGGKRVLGPIREVLDFQRAIRHGLPYAAFEALLALLETPCSSGK